MFLVSALDDSFAAMRTAFPVPKSTKVAVILAKSRNFKVACQAGITDGIGSAAVDFDEGDQALASFPLGHQ